MLSITDKTFGHLSYEYNWNGDFEISIFGVLSRIRLCVSCDEGDEIEDSQREAFVRFVANRDRLIASAERAVFDYYQDNVAELRERFGTSADDWAPLVADTLGVGHLLKIRTLFIPKPFEHDKRVVGLLFDCSWEQELGLAVKFVNEKVEEVGPQDIVL